MTLWGGPEGSPGAPREPSGSIFDLILGVFLNNFAVFFHGRVVKNLTSILYLVLFVVVENTLIFEHLQMNPTLKDLDSD